MIHCNGSITLTSKPKEEEIDPLTYISKYTVIEKVIHAVIGIEVYTL